MFFPLLGSCHTHCRVLGAVPRCQAVLTAPSLNLVPRTVQVRKMHGFESARSCLATAPTRLSGLTATSRVCPEKSHPCIGPGHLVSAVVAGYVEGLKVPMPGGCPDTT